MRPQQRVSVGLVGIGSWVSAVSSNGCAEWATGRQRSDPLHVQRGSGDACVESTTSSHDTENG